MLASTWSHGEPGAMFECFSCNSCLLSIAMETRGSMQLALFRSKLLVLYALVIVYGGGCLFLLSLRVNDETPNTNQKHRRLIHGSDRDASISSEWATGSSKQSFLQKEVIDSHALQRQHGIISLGGSSAISSPWDNLPYVSALPAWAKEYFAWHRDSLDILNKNHTKWKSYRYLLIRCLNMDDKCGGLSDRLHSIPLALLLASQYQRILFIDWEKPAALTAFLLPAALDWRIPSWFEIVTTKRQRNASCDHCPILHLQRSPTILSDKHFYRLEKFNQAPLLDMRYQTNDHGRAYFNAVAQDRETDNSSWEDVYAAVWHSFFQPSPPVQTLINDAVRQLGLEHRNYVSLHIRSIYYKDKSNKTSRIENAVHCATSLADSSKTNLPATFTRQSPIVYVASDSSHVAQYAADYGSTLSGRFVARRTVVNGTASHPLHLDRGSNFLSGSSNDWMIHDASSYYSVFVDLYLLSHGRCVVYNVGGFGQLASLISWPSDKQCQSRRYTNELCQRPDIQALPTIFRER
jgi:hypothetical protein